MSWLYTIIFAGLVASSQQTSNQHANRAMPIDPVAAHTVVMDETEKFEQTYPLTANGRVKVSNINGSIIVEAWDQNSVKLEYTKTADSKERLKDVEIRIDSNSNSFSVETDYGKGERNNVENWHSRGKLNVDFHLMVPRGAILDEIETVNGSVSVANFVNYTKVSAVNGSVTATNCRGNAKLSTVNGEVKADFDSLDAGSKISLNTVNGRVNLIIPSDANATLKADSLNGTISNDFGLPVRKGKYVGRDMYGRLGSGDVQIRLNSVNGGLSVGRKNDGKNPAQATDLLPQKGRDDDDWDNDEQSLLQTSKMNKDIAKAMKESSQVSAKAMADAQREMARIQPELARITAESTAEAAKVLQSKDFKEQLKNAVNLRTEAFARLSDIGFGNSIPRVEAKSNSFTVKGNPMVTVLAKNCSVSVHGWDKSEVQYRITQVSASRSNEPLGVTEDQNDSGVTLRVVNPNDPGQGGFFNEANRVHIDVYVPRKSNLKIDASGGIRLENVSGEIELSGSDESINVRDVDGKLHLESSDGRIRVVGFRGDIDAKTSDGMISLEGDFTKLNATSSDGEIILTLAENASADVTSNRGEVRSEGISLTKIGGSEEQTKFRIGKGGSPFKLETDGAISIRSAATLAQIY